MDIESPLKAYHDTMGGKPLADTAARAAIAGGAAYALSGPLVRKLVSAAGQSGNPRLQQIVERFVAPGGDWRKGRARLAAFAAGLGGLTGLMTHADTSRGLGGFVDSMTQEGYWSNPDNMRSGPLEESLKVAGLQAPSMSRPSIDTWNAYETVVADPYLEPEEKSTVNKLVLAASEGKRRFPPGNITHTAVQAGVDFGTAYLLGRGLGVVLGFPKHVSKRLSLAGGLANAVRGSGLFG